MPRGLQVRNGEFIHPDMRLGQAYGQFFTGTSNGTFAIPYSANGTPYFVALPDGAMANRARLWRSGDNVYWDFGQIPAEYRVSTRVLYGRY